MLLFSTAACAKTEPESNTSRLEGVTDIPNCYRYHAGDGSISEITLASDLSKKGDRIVIFVATNPNNEAKAVGHARKIASWFEGSVDSIDSVPVVIYPNDKGVGYTFLINGTRYWHAVHAPKMFMNPSQTVVALEDAVLTYRARVEVQIEARK